MLINIKPLSVNNCWQGKRYKTKEYKAYEKELLYLLPNKKNIQTDGDLKVSITFGFSNCNSDADNPVKPFVDILQKKYGFNDNKIYEYHIKKVITNKGEEFIDFEVGSVNN